MNHPLGVWGLSINAAGTLLLLIFPPKVDRYTPDGVMIMGGFSEIPDSAAQRRQWRRAYLVRRWGYQVAVTMLLIGFLLQLLDLIAT